MTILICHIFLSTYLSIKFGHQCIGKCCVSTWPLGSRHVSSELNTSEPSPTFFVKNLISSVTFASAQYQSRRPLSCWASELGFQAAARLHIPLTSTTQKLSS